MGRRVVEPFRAQIQGYEDCKLVAYQDVGGVWTIGRGATGPGIVRGTVWTQEQADRRFDADLGKAEAAVERLVKVELTDGQFAALCSLTFNIGVGAFTGSTLLRKLNGGDYEAVPIELMKWTRVGKRKGVAGLVNRRASECGMWARGTFVTGAPVPAVAPKPTIWTKATASAAGIGTAGVAAVTNALSQDPVGSIQSTVAAVKEAHELGLRDDQPTPGIVIQEQHAAHSVNVMAWGLGIAALVIVALVVTVIWQRVHHVKEVSG